VIINGYDATKSTVAEDTAADVIRNCAQVEILAVTPYDDTIDHENFHPGDQVIKSLSLRDWQKLGKR
jgi:hypothetical protein